MTAREAARRVVARARRRAVAFVRSHPGVWATYRVWRARQRAAVVRWHARGPLRPGVIAFESFNGRSYAGSPRALYEAMLGDPRFASCTFVWSFRDPAHAREFAALADPRTRIVQHLSGTYYKAFQSAQVWITNAIIAPELRPAASQVYVQTWHGTPLKRIGLDAVDASGSVRTISRGEIEKRYRDEGAKITHFLSSAPFTTEAFASAFGLTASGPGSPLVETGQPRNDVLALADEAARIAARERLGIPPGRRTVLYAPTWRDDEHDARAGFVHTPPLDVERLREALGPDWLLLFRAHYFVTNAVDFSRTGDFAMDVSGVDDVNDVLLAADVLVTDYSSIYFDYALLDRPMVFYLYDLERYAGSIRGFYLPIEDVPGPIVRTQDELTAALLAPDLVHRDAARRAELTAQMSPSDDGQASGRVLDLLRADLDAV